MSDAKKRPNFVITRSTRSLGAPIRRRGSASIGAPVCLAAATVLQRMLGEQNPMLLELESALDAGQPGWFVDLTDFPADELLGGIHLYMDGLPDMLAENARLRLVLAPWIRNCPGLRRR